jgi:hypothetical protein
MQSFRRGCKKLAQKLTCMDTSWEPKEFVPPTGKTSTMRTPPAFGVRTGATPEDHVEYTEEEEDHASAFGIHRHRPQRDEDFDWPWEEIGPS